ncbi:MAG: phage holin family protein [Candidatus Paceibacterota bacterium]
MAKLIAKLLVVALAFLFAAWLVPGIEVAGFYTALILAVLWGILNLIVRPLLVFVTLPINLITFGLFSLVINGFLFWFLGTFIKGFFVEGFLTAILGAFIVALAMYLGNEFIRGK